MRHRPRAKAAVRHLSRREGGAQQTTVVKRPFFKRPFPSLQAQQWPCIRTSITGWELDNGLGNCTELHKVRLLSTPPDTKNLATGPLFDPPSQPSLSLSWAEYPPRPAPAIAPVCDPAVRLPTVPLSSVTNPPSLKSNHAQPPTAEAISPPSEGEPLFSVALLLHGSIAKANYHKVHFPTPTSAA